MSTRGPCLQKKEKNLLLSALPFFPVAREKAALANKNCFSLCQRDK